MPARILIADDSDQMRSAITFLLRGLGCEVCAALNDGDTVVQKAVELKPDLLILDIAMPKRDGWSAGRELLASLPNTPILLYTMLPAAFLEQEAKLQGFSGVIDKDNTTALIAAIRNALESRPASETPA